MHLQEILFYYSDELTRKPLAAVPLNVYGTLAHWGALAPALWPARPFSSSLLCVLSSSDCPGPAACSYPDPRACSSPLSDPSEHLWSGGWTC